MHRLLLQTTIEGEPDDWNIDRFGLLRTFLEELRDEGGQPAFAVVARNRVIRQAIHPQHRFLARRRGTLTQAGLRAAAPGAALSRAARTRRFGRRSVERKLRAQLVACPSAPLLSWVLAPASSKASRKNV